MYAIRWEEKPYMASGWSDMVMRVFISTGTHFIWSGTQNQEAVILFPALGKGMRQEGKQVGGLVSVWLAWIQRLPDSSWYSTQKLHVHLLVLLFREAEDILIIFLSHENESSNL